MDDKGKARKMFHIEFGNLAVRTLYKPTCLSTDIPLSYGLVDMNLDPAKINQADFIWDPTKETGLYFKVHAISTEFTAKKHGGEKGVPFRIQIETYSHNDGENKLLHAASCQIKVFKVSHSGSGVCGCVGYMSGKKCVVNWDPVFIAQLYHRDRVSRCSR